MAASEAPHEYQRAASEMNACVHTMAAVQNGRGGGVAGWRQQTAGKQSHAPLPHSMGQRSCSSTLQPSIAVPQLAAAPDRTPRKTVSSTRPTNVLTLQGSRGEASMHTCDSMGGHSPGACTHAQRDSQAANVNTTDVPPRPLPPPPLTREGQATRAPAPARRVSWQTARWRRPTAGAGRWRWRLQWCRPARASGRR